jgi:hypothetical protein
LRIVTTSVLKLASMLRVFGDVVQGSAPVVVKVAVD